MKLWPSSRRKSARAIIVRDGKVLLFLRKRYSTKTGEWIEYFSVPGGGIDRGESADDAVVRELREEMGVTIELDGLVAHNVGRRFEHYVYAAKIIDGEPHLVMDSEEAALMSERNQFIVQWVPVGKLTRENLRYYCDYLEIIQQLAAGTRPSRVLHIDAR